MKPIVNAYSNLTKALFLLAVIPHIALAGSSWSIGGNESGLVELNDKFEKAGSVFTNVVRLVLVILFIIALVRFVKEKKWIDLGFCVISLIGLGYAEKFADALYKFGNS